jgi:hypothetical protein
LGVSTKLYRKMFCDYDNDKRISYRMDFLKNKARTIFHLFM